MVLPIWFSKYIQDKDSENMLEIELDKKINIDWDFSFIDRSYFSIGKNVIYGHDIHNRYFMSILYECNETPNKLYIMSIYQKYPDEQGYFITCGDTFINPNTIRSASINHYSNKDKLDKQFEYFFKLINDYTITITDYCWDIYKESYILIKKTYNMYYNN
jgi:hypothetical protein